METVQENNGSCDKAAVRNGSVPDTMETARQIAGEVTRRVLILTRPKPNQNIPYQSSAAVVTLLFTFRVPKF